MATVNDTYKKFGYLAKVTLVVWNSTRKRKFGIYFGPTKIATKPETFDLIGYKTRVQNEGFTVVTRYPRFDWIQKMYMRGNHKLPAKLKDISF